MVRAGGDPLTPEASPSARKRRVPLASDREACGLEVEFEVGRQKSADTMTPHSTFFHRFSFEPEKRGTMRESAILPLKLNSELVGVSGKGLRLPWETDSSFRLLYHS